MRTIVLTGGGTAGHVLPNIALLPYLKKTFSKIVYIGGIGGIEKDIISSYPEIIYHGITTVKFRRALTIKNLTIPFKLLQGIREAKKILKQIKPDIIFSKGGFVALPAVLAGHKLKIPIVAHESDITMGLANRITAKKCSVICTTFPDAAKKYKNAVHTGAILRGELFADTPQLFAAASQSFADTPQLFAAAPQSFVTAPQLFAAAHQKPHQKPNVLITGGSSGSAAINNIIFSSAGELTKHYNLLHITGKNKSNPNLKFSNYTQTEYTSRPQELFAWADIVVSRAGSGTLCELIALNKPAVFIPLPKTESRGDQILNANFAASFGGCTVLPQERLTAETLLNAISQTQNKKWQNISWINGTQKVAEIIKNTAIRP
jgi:UDP-N-acetylglucosamine--N-acetylmuramyl-(pentapeptide) pyrophosphoryl-undecaprenol N-acetylglucosamine transferase